MPIKENLLKNLTVKELKQLAKDNRINPKCRNIFGDTWLASTKEELIEILSKSPRITKEKISAFLEPTPKMKVSEKVEEEHVKEKIVAERFSSQIKEIIERIRHFKPPRRISKESQLEDLIVTHLRVWYPDLRTQLSYERTRIDAQIGKIGIEIKLSPDEGELDRLYGQIDKYLEHLDSIISVIFYERSRESTEFFKKRLTKRGWLDNKVFVLSL